LALRRAKAAGFTTLVVTLDTFLLGWRLRDLDTTSLPFAVGFGLQVGTSDAVFMRRQQLPPRPDECPAFPLNLNAFRVRLAVGDEQAQPALRGCKKPTQACSAHGTISRSCVQTGTVRSCYCMADVAYFSPVSQADGRSMEPLVRSAPSRRSPCQRGCAAVRNEPYSPSGSTRVSGWAAMSSRPRDGCSGSSR
jgi:hypothetical protein